MLEGILFEGLIYSIMVFGVYITFRFLDFPDLTVDGSFSLGACVTAMLLLKGFPVSIAMLLAFLAGSISGFFTALIHNKLKIPNLLAGILTMTMLYSINIRVLGNRANLPLLKVETIFTKISNLASGLIPQDYTVLIFLVFFIVLTKVILDVFFITDLGLSLRALGNNERFITMIGINPEYLKLIGVSLANGLVGLSGSLVAQYQGFADIGMGQGIIISGLASVMLGEFFIFSKRNVFILTTGVITGSVFYKAIMYVGRFYGYYINMTPNDLKLITGLLIIISIIITKFGKTQKREEQW
jgi:putative ABC transport system permease protein